MLESIKDRVRFVNGPMAMCHATMVVSGAYEYHGLYLDLTGGLEKHEHPSLHAYGAALDYGTRGCWKGDKDRSGKLYQLASFIRTRLGDGYDVVFEEVRIDNAGKVTRGEHLHIEYQPKDWHRN